MNVREVGMGIFDFTQSLAEILVIIILLIVIIAKESLRDLIREEDNLHTLLKF